MKKELPTLTAKPKETFEQILAEDFDTIYKRPRMKGPDSFFFSRNASSKLMLPVSQVQPIIDAGYIIKDRDPQGITAWFLNEELVNQYREESISTYGQGKRVIS